MKEADIRPQALLERYLELSALDAEACFATAPRVSLPCVACGGERQTLQFEKNGFPYSRCEDCGTLFQCPRPPLASFEAFYRDSVSSRYWAEEFFPAVAEARREKMFVPRVERLARLCGDRHIPVACVAEVGAGYGIFLEEWRRRFPDTRALAIEPGAALARTCRAKGFEVVEDIVEHVEGYDGVADLVACFEVLEHTYSPLTFVERLARLARPGGAVCISTLGVDGFDIQVLWDRSNAIFPPHHINFLSVKGFERLFARAGLVDVEVITPGVLDIDIVRNAFRRDPSLLNGQRFVRHLVEDERRGAEFQRFLSANQLSSHTWVIATKPAPAA
jgi:SAM-dependent methyltransferase